ncbi:MAG: glutamate--tRNA ligase [Ruminococcaceae bacterium]|nr:glutamate--tRNA ligase [Oscillospiraceae bacterium]
MYRTRFAPSPTGYMHVGNLRTALYAYLITKKENGSFILRIEDTDQERYVEGAVDIIYNTMRETGLLWDEGPDVGGEYGPYIQSERRPLYREYAEKLCELGGAYYCFCTKERLEQLHTEAGGIAKYDGCCRDIPLEEARQRAAAGEPYVIRQRMPREGETSFDDAVFGLITVDNSELEDQILLKSDGLPTYNFANVIDDHLMGITHVVRGSEYLSSTPKYNLLYQAFGWEPPVYIHCPPVMKDAQNKLSKRNGDASYQDLVAKGYLTGAILNYIALLGWSPGGEQEKFSLEELVQAFDIKGISKSPAIFDPEKLRWLNAEYIRAMSLEQFHEAALPYILEGAKGAETDTMLIAGCLHQRTEVLSEIPPQIDFISGIEDYSIDLFTNKKSKSNPETSKAMLEAAIPVLEALPQWTQEAIHDSLIGLAEGLQVKNGLLMWPVRIAVSGRTVTPGGAVEVLGMVGREQSLLRLHKALEMLS